MTNVMENLITMSFYFKPAEGSTVKANKSRLLRAPTPIYLQATKRPMFVDR